MVIRTVGSTVSEIADSVNRFTDTATIRLQMSGPISDAPKKCSTTDRTARDRIYIYT